METEDKKDDLLQKVDPGRRAFVKKIIIGSAFAVPLMQSFSMDGLKIKAAHAMIPPHSP